MSVMLRKKVPIFKSVIHQKIKRLLALKMLLYLPTPWFDQNPTCHGQNLGSVLNVSNIELFYFAKHAD